MIWSQKSFEQQCDEAAHGRSALLPGESSCPPWRPQFHNDVEGKKEAIVDYMEVTSVGSAAHLVLDLYDHLKQAGLIPTEELRRTLDREAIKEEIQILFLRAPKHLDYYLITR